MKEFVYRTSVAACRYYRLIFFIRMSNVRLLASSGLPVGYYVSHFFFHLVERERERKLSCLMGCLYGETFTPWWDFYPLFFASFVQNEGKKKKGFKKDWTSYIYTRACSIFGIGAVRDDFYISSNIYTENLLLYFWSLFIFWSMGVAVEAVGMVTRLVVTGLLRPLHGICHDYKSPSACSIRANVGGRFIVIISRNVH